MGGGPAGSGGASGAAFGGSNALGGLGSQATGASGAFPGHSAYLQPSAQGFNPQHQQVCLDHADLFLKVVLRLQVVLFIE